MNKIGLGIAIILFAILLELSTTGRLACISSGIGALGLILAAACAVMHSSTAGM